MKITHKDAPFDHHEAQPDTTWIAPLVGMVVIIALGYIMLIIGCLIEVVNL
jgi:hypothetical protein